MSKFVHTSAFGGTVLVGHRSVVVCVCGEIFEEQAHRTAISLFAQHLREHYEKIEDSMK